MTIEDLGKLKEGDFVVLRQMYRGLYGSLGSAKMKVLRKHHSGSLLVKLPDGAEKSISSWDVERAA